MAPPAQTEDELPPFQGLPASLCKKLQTGICTGQFQKITCSMAANKRVRHLTAKPFWKNGVMAVQWERQEVDGKVFHKNMTPEAAFETLMELIKSGDYRQYHLTGEGTLALKRTKKQKLLISDHWHITPHGTSLAMQTGQGHNREKHYFFQDGEYEPFLYHLGISDKTGRVYDKKRAKFRQINRFLQIIEDIYPPLPQNGTLYVCDLCCGKSYLTFAAYRYLTKAHNRTVDICGMDRKEDVIALCRDTAQTLGYDGMHFIFGDINDYHPPYAPHLVLSLHACDIATDVVLYHAQRLGAGVILSTPCCQHELAAQLRANVTEKKAANKSNGQTVSDPTRTQGVQDQQTTGDTSHTDPGQNAEHTTQPAVSYTANNLLFPILHHGLLTEKFAAVCTDALRATWLEAMGYEVATVELIDPEETPKNLLIRAVKRTRPDEIRCAHAKEQYKAMCAFLGVHPFLERYLPQ